MYYGLHKNNHINTDNNQKFIFNTRKNGFLISERSCDTEDWINDTENSALHHRNKLHFKIYYNSLF